MEANYFTILYWFCHTPTWIHHRRTGVPHPEPPFHLPPHIIPPGHPRTDFIRWLSAKESTCQCKKIQEMQVWPLGWEDPLEEEEMATHSYSEDPVEEEIATHSNILARRIPWTEETGRLPSKRSQRARHDWGAEHSHALFRTKERDQVEEQLFYLS